MSFFIVGSLVRPDVSLSPCLGYWGVQDTAPVVSCLALPRPRGSHAKSTSTGPAVFLVMGPMDWTLQVKPRSPRTPVWKLLLSVSSSRILCFLQGHGDILLFPSQDFLVLIFTFRSMIHLKWTGLKFHCFRSICEIIFLFPLNCFGTLVGNQLTV